jgi:hypothetical protein
MPETSMAVKPKQMAAQATMQALSCAGFCVAGALWWWWSQSGIACVTDISVAAETLAAKPIVAGSVAMATASRTVKTVRAMRFVTAAFVHSQDTTVDITCPKVTNLPLIKVKTWPAHQNTRRRRDGGIASFENTLGIVQFRNVDLSQGASRDLVLTSIKINFAPRPIDTREAKRAPLLGAPRLWSRALMPELPRDAMFR